MNIGSVIAFNKNYTNTPTLDSKWVECNGQVLNDVESPLNGQTLPNLNSTNRFLRGSTTSGATGGSATKSHGHSVDLNVTMTNATIDPRGYAFNTASVLPDYYTVVWIIKIK
jgi:hypothetical protein